MTLDFTPFKAFSVGFDDLFNELSKIKTVGYPPYNIEKVKDGEYKISMALAGFGKSEIDVSVKENVLKVEGINEVDLKLVWNPPWTKDMMSEAAKLELNL